MSHNKGKRYIKCPECDRKKYCSFSYVQKDKRRWICSKGHEWLTDILTAEKVAKIMAEVFTADKVANLFERDDIFYRRIRR